MTNNLMSDLSVDGIKDPQLVRSDWTPASAPRIDGVVTKQISSVLGNDGYLTEMWRSDWQLDDRPVDQVFQRILAEQAISGWHVHHLTTDRLFCATGRVHVVLYDARTSSPSHGTIAEFRFGEQRPAIVVVPPGVFHAVKNIGTTPAVFINAVDVAYSYDDPDHYRLPIDTPLIPYQFR